MISDPPYAPDSVRPEYREGLWEYALGTPASTHPKYAEACEKALAGGWSPWWIRTLGDVEATLEGCRFDFDAGNRVCDFLERLVLSKGKFSGKTLKLIDWQRWDFIMPLYGWIRADGTRRYSQGGIWVPKKNGKSGVCAGLILYHLIADGEGSPCVWVCACDTQQARIVFDEARNMVLYTPGLSKLLEIVEYKKMIKCARNSGEFFAMSSEVTQKEGLNWSFGIYDELHVGSRAMWDTLAGGSLVRENPLKLSISTAGEYDQTSIGWEQWIYCKKVLSGAITDTSFFGLMYYAEVGGEDEEDETGETGESALAWDDPVTVKRANPSLGVIQAERHMEARITEARNAPKKQNSFKRYHLNIWVNADESWMPQAKWHACRGEFAASDLVGKECFAGLDLSDTNDMTALTLTFPGDVSRVLTFYWLPEKNVDELDKAHGIGGHYREWWRKGLLKLTSGERINHDEILSDLHEIINTFNVVKLGFDPYNASAITTALQKDYGEEFCLEVRQGMLTMGVATKALEGLIANKKIQHDGNPITDWQFSNCSLVHDKAGNYMLTKVSGKARKKIDGIVSMAMALYLQDKLWTGITEEPQLMFI